MIKLTFHDHIRDTNICKYHLYVLGKGLWIQSGVLYFSYTSINYPNEKNYDDKYTMGAYMIANFFLLMDVLTIKGPMKVIKFGE
jgi:hypothetical protein